MQKRGAAEAQQNSGAAIQSVCCSAPLPSLKTRSRIQPFAIERPQRRASTKMPYWLKLVWLFAHDARGRLGPPCTNTSRQCSTARILVFLVHGMFSNFWRGELEVYI